MGRPRKYSPEEKLIATTSGVWVSPEGEELPFYEGRTIVERGHPLAEACPGYFKPIEAHYKRPSVEQMTAGPGELRGEEAEVF